MGQIHSSRMSEPGAVGEAVVILVPDTQEVNSASPNKNRVLGCTDRKENKRTMKTHS